MAVCVIPGKHFIGLGLWVVDFGNMVNLLKIVFFQVLTGHSEGLSKEKIFVTI